FGQRYDAQGAAQGSAFVVNATGGRFGRLSSDGQGNLVASWSVYTSAIVGGTPVATFTGIDGQRFTDQGILQGGVFTLDTSAIPAGTIRAAKSGVAMDGAGNVELAFTTVNPNAEGNYLLGQRYGSAGNAIGGLERFVG